MALTKISKSPFFLLLLILLLASFFRLWQLSDVPPGLYPDEALNANTAIEALSKGEYQIFYVDNNGREGLYMNLVALSFGFFGISMWSFRIVGAVAGILTVFGLYFLVREIFLLFWFKTRQATLIALFSSFFLAISFWHINFSRIGFRAVLMPLVLVFSFYFLLRGFRSRRLWHFIAAGLLFGIGFHTYISFRLAVLPLAILILTWFLLAAKERWLKKYTKSVVLFSLFLFLTALPIGLYFLQNPQDFISRATGISVFATDAPLLSFGKSLARHLAMFHISGDPNWRHNISGIPQLSFIAGFFFLLGLFSFLSRTGSALLQKNIRAVAISAFVFAWFFALLLPGALTFEGIPHALRVLGVIPIVYMFVGMGAFLFFAWLQKRVSPRAAGTLLLVVLVGLTGLSFHNYFMNWATRSETKAAFTQRFVEVGSFLNDLPENTKAYVIKSEGELPVETSKFLQATAGRDNAQYLSLEELPELKSGDFVVTMNKDREAIDRITAQFPQGTLQELEKIWVYQIK